jgi:hypothetical protein
VKKLLIACLFLSAGCDNTWQNLPLSTEKAREAIKYDLKRHKLPERLFTKRAVIDEKSAVTAAEEILFPIYGEKKIKGEHPYTVGYADGYWIIYGYLPPYSLGGVFSIIIYGKTGEVMYWTHGK